MASGFSVGTIQQTLTNLAEGRAWYAGVSESALIGAVSGAVAGGVVGAAKPQSLPAKMLVGGVAGGGVGGGMRATSAKLHSHERGGGAAVERGPGAGHRHRGHDGDDRRLHRPLRRHAGGAGDDAAADARGGG